MEIKKFDTYHCDDCEETFLVTFDRYIKFCPYCGNDVLTYVGETKMVEKEA